MKMLRAIIIATFAVTAGAAVVTAAERTAPKIEVTAPGGASPESFTPPQCRHQCLLDYQSCIRSHQSSDTCDEAFGECVSRCTNNNH